MSNQSNQARQGPDPSIHLSLRTRVEAFRGSGDWAEVTLTRAFPADETALLICDVWDKHWSRGASERVDAMAPRINEVVQALRGQGVFVVHAPSDTLEFYRDDPARRCALEAPFAELPSPLELPDPPLPIDDSDGGSDTGETSWYPAWSRQHPAIEIREEDAISDRGQEVFNLLRQRGIRNVLVLGVHTNMCVTPSHPVRLEAASSDATGLTGPGDRQQGRKCEA